MDDKQLPKPRRDFLKLSVAGAAAMGIPVASEAQTAAAKAAAASPGYVWLRPNEQSFVEALVNHMCPADELTGNGMALGLNVFFDRILGGEWGQGSRLYLKGPFPKGTPNQGYQLGLTPSQLFRAGTEGLNEFCKKQFNKPFETLAVADKESVLKDLQTGKIKLSNEIPSNTYFSHLYQMFTEAMFSDPIYGGNRNKAGWKMIGYPGVSTNNRQNIVKFKNIPFKVEPTSISDVS